MDDFQQTHEISEIKFNIDNKIHISNVIIVYGTIHQQLRKTRSVPTGLTQIRIPSTCMPPVPPILNYLFPTTLALNHDKDISNIPHILK